MFFRLFALFAVLTVAFANPEPKPEPAVVAYTAGAYPYAGYGYAGYAAPVAAAYPYAAAAYPYGYATYYRK
ncbi:hypothetical protein PYW08_013430 [Mythimna loreyi]|uniref:Uncharacterized protein n=1 Tax=Mythimna loreyi TaxID=667449 RepID=A0ACC2QHI8_9NEOP|nr:hypothetical protein PYW08_013430 [Mythimna loreyi]